MHNEDLFFQAFVYLAAAVLSVPIAKRLGLGSVLGYLVAGVVIGPFVLGFVGQEGEDVMHFAEFGVVMMRWHGPLIVFNSNRASNPQGKGAN